jgi:hypothetical protein
MDGQDLVTIPDMFVYEAARKITERGALMMLCGGLRWQYGR